MKIVSSEARPDYTTLTIDWATFDRSTAVPSDYQAGASTIAEVIWSLFCGNDDTYIENAVEAARPLPFYPTVFTVPLMGFTVGWGAPKQGIIVQLSGAWWSMIGSHADLKAASASGWKCTRWDEALTITTEPMEGSLAEQIASHYRHYEYERLGDDVRWHHPYMQKAFQTHYCGSRKSGRFARVYDKSELETDENRVVRIEVEYKRQWAPSVFKAWLDTREVDLRLLSAYLIGETKANDHPLIADAMVGRKWGEAPKPVPQPLANRTAWFYDQIAKAWLNWAHEDTRGALVWIDQMRARVAPEWDDVSADEFNELVAVARKNLGLSE